MSWRRAITTASLALCLLGAAPLRAPAQEPPPAATRSERPSAGSWRRGVVSLPAAAVVGTGALVVLVAGTLLMRRARKRQR